MARRPRTAPASPVTWRDGVHLTGTPIWCDARRRRDVCFVSSAERVVRAGHSQLIATPLTLALLGAPAGSHLAVPVHKPFTLGTMRLELIPSGRGLGAAALHVDVGRHSVLYAGAIRAVDPHQPAEVRAADALVVAAPLGEPHHRVPRIEDVAAELVTWTRGRLAASKVPILVVDSVIDGLEVGRYLAEADLLVAASRPVRDAAARLAVADPLSIPMLRAPGKEPMPVIRVDGEKLSGPAPGEVALVSIRALDRPGGWDAVFTWPSVAGTDQLLAWIEHARAKQIFVTGPYAEAIAEALGPRARVLGPPRQMALFGS